MLLEDVFILYMDLQTEASCESDKKLKDTLQDVNIGGGIGIPYRPDQQAMSLERVGEGIENAYREMDEAELRAAEAYYCSMEDKLRQYLDGKNIVLVPKSFEKYFSAATVEILKSFSGSLVECYYEMDEGTTECN